MLWTPVVVCVFACFSPISLVFYLENIRPVVAAFRKSRAWRQRSVKPVLGSYPAGTAGWLLAHPKTDPKGLRRSPAGYLMHFRDLVQAQIFVPSLVAPPKHTVLPVVLDNWPSCCFGKGLQLYYDCSVCRAPVTATAAHWMQHVFSGQHQQGVQTWHELDMQNWQGISRASFYV